MLPWTNQDGTKTHLVNSTSANAARAATETFLSTIRQSLSAIETELQKYESLDCPDWGHVGDLTHLDEILEQACEFVRGAK